MKKWKKLEENCNFSFFGKLQFSSSFFIIIFYHFFHFFNHFSSFFYHFSSIPPLEAKMMKNDKKNEKNEKKWKHEKTRGKLQFFIFWKIAIFLEFFYYYFFIIFFIFLIIFHHFFIIFHQFHHRKRICLCIAGVQLYTWWHTCAYHVHERCHSANPCVSFLFVIVQIGWWSHAMNLYVSDGGRNTTLSRKKMVLFFGTEKVKTTLDLVAQSNDTWFDWTPKNGTILIRFPTCMPIMIFQHESMNPNWATTLAQ